MQPSAPCPVLFCSRQWCPCKAHLSQDIGQPRADVAACAPSNKIDTFHKLAQALPSHVRQHLLPLGHCTRTETCHGFHWDHHHFIGIGEGRTTFSISSPALPPSLRSASIHRSDSQPRPSTSRHLDNLKTRSTGSTLIWKHIRDRVDSHSW